MFAFFVAVVFIVGVVTPIQTAMNTELRRRAGTPVAACFVSFLTGLAVLALLSLAEGIHGFPYPSTCPWWAWCGGLAGAVFILGNILLFPRLGAVQTVLLPTLGQIFAGAAIDHFGLLGLPETPLSLMGTAGLFLAAAGAGLAVAGGHQKAGEHTPRGAKLPWQIFGIAAGILAALQPCMNGTLAVSLGSTIRASLVSFAVSLAVAAALVAVRPADRLALRCLARTGAPWWAWLGGALGAVFVAAVTVAVPVTGAALLTVLIVFGMLCSGLMLDAFGWLGTERRRIPPQQPAGLALMFFGIIASKML